MRLELKRNKISTYVISSLAFTVVMLGFLYLMAYAPQLEPNDQDLKQLFMNYRNIILLISVLNMAVFCILSAVMYSKFIIEEYAGKRAILLFSYPISRKKTFAAKIAVVSLFTIIAMILSNLIIFTIFGVTEGTFPLMAKTNIIFATQVIKTTLIMAILAAGLGIVATGIGFIQKSVPATIISAVLLCSLVSNLVLGNLTSDIPSIVFTAIAIIAGLVITNILASKVNHMEVE